MDWGKAVVAVLVASGMSLAGCGAGNSPADEGPAGGGEERQRAEGNPNADQSGRDDVVLDDVVRDTEDGETPSQAPRNEPAEASEDPPDPETARVDDGIGAPSLTVPASWTEVIRGAESETGSGSWSTFAGQTVASSVTASPSLYDWSNVSGAPGIYAVVSRSLASVYADGELVRTGPNDMGACQLASGYGLSRGPYKGLVQEWQNCGESGTGIVTAVASPEGRECVLLMQFAAPRSGAVVDEAQRDLLLDGFEIDCSRL